MASTQWLLNTKKTPIIRKPNINVLYTCFYEWPRASMFLVYLNSTPKNNFYKSCILCLWVHLYMKGTMFLIRPMHCFLFLEYKLFLTNSKSEPLTWSTELEPNIRKEDQNNKKSRNKLYTRSTQKLKISKLEFKQITERLYHVQ